MPEEMKRQTENKEAEVRYVERKRLLFFGLPWTFTKYTITDDMLTVDEGFLTVEENDCYMYKIQDVKLTASVLERMFKLGTIVCYTGDVTNKELKLVHIKHAKESKSFICWRRTKQARIKRRILHTQDIGAGDTRRRMRSFLCEKLYRDISRAHHSSFWMCPVCF